MKQNDILKYLSSDGEILTAENFSTIMKNMKVQDKMFMNSECMVVEYNDILKCPWFVLLTVIDQNKKLEPIMNLDKISSLDADSRFEWYCNRENRNFLYDITKIPPDAIDYDELLSILMKSEILYEIDSTLNAKDAIDIALKQKQVKEVIIYNETNDSYMRKDIEKMYGKYKNVKFRCGEFSDVIKDVPIDSSYMLSDFTKVITMAECNKLNMSSVILPYDFEYNYIKNDDGERVPIVDFTYLGKENLFKVHFFNACYQ